MAKLTVNKEMDESELLELAEKVFANKLHVPTKMLPLFCLVLQRHYKTKKRTIRKLGAEIADKVWDMEVRNAENVDISLKVVVRKKEDTSNPLVKGICMRCGYYNPKSTQFYKCRVPGSCPACTDVPKKGTK